MSVHFIGAGPGAPDLITVRGLKFIKQADVVLYAGSLVPEAVISEAPFGAKVIDTAPLHLDEIINEIEDYENYFFTVMETNLLAPEQGADNIPLNFTFTWDGPTDVPEYELWISNEEDPELQNPAFKILEITSELHLR